MKGFETGKRDDWMFFLWNLKCGLATLGLCLFSKGMQLGLSLTRYSTSLQRHTLTCRALMVKPMFSTHDKVSGFYPAENK